MIVRLLKKLPFMICMSCCSLVYSQQFNSKAVLKGNAQTGFYAVDITPALSTLCKPGFEDLRVADEKDHFIPYIIRQPAAAFYQQNFEAFTILSNTLTDSGRSSIVVENNQRKPVNDIVLIIRNAAVNRMANISGSDNARDWFTIAESIHLESRYSDSSDQYIQYLHFPLSSYRYFKLIIYNGKNDALNVMSVGKYVTQEKEQTIRLYNANPACSFQQKDSGALSGIKIRQTANYHTDRITLHVNGPKFFRREGEIVTKNIHQPFSISSDTSFTFYTSTFNDQDIRINIFNGDNPPLKITGIETAQRVKQVITWLEAGKDYQLWMNDSAAVKPSYDLQQFRDSIPRNVPSVTIASINTTAMESKERQSRWKYWLWPVMILVLIVVGLFTLRLAKEVQRRK